MKTSPFLVVLATAIVTGRTFAGTFSDNFSTGLNPTYWSISNSVPSVYSVNAPGGTSGVGLANTGGVSGLQGVGIVLNLAALGGNITGDFSAQINFSNYTLTGPGDEQMSLDTGFLNGSAWDDIRNEYIGEYTSPNVHVWDGGSIEGGFATTATSGTLSITRTSGNLVAYFDGTEVSGVGNSSPLSYLAFSLESQGNDSTDTSTVTFSNFSITAASVPVPEPASLSLLTIASAGTLARRHRTQPKTKGIP